MADVSRSRVPVLCFAALYQPPDGMDPEQYLRSVPILREIPSALARRGFSVHVVQQFPVRARFTRGGVHYHFVRPFTAAARVLAGVTPWSAGSHDPALPAVRAIRSIRPDLIHLHGTNLYLSHFILLAAMGRRRPPIVVQYHGGYPSPNLLARRLQRFNLHRSNRILFTTRSHAEPFVNAGLIDVADRIVDFMQTSSTFNITSRERARRTTGMDGDPVFLWAARLDEIKDPLTALRGFEMIVARRPRAQLYLHYLTDEMLPDTHAFVDARPQLRGHVHFRGRIPLEQMEQVYNSADFLLQGSRREFSGRTVLEAMACGVIPVVTDIPSFRAMTDDGRFGVHFPMGDARALAREVLSIPTDQIAARSEQVRARFESALSFPVLTDRLEAIYRDVLEAPDVSG